MSNVDLDRFAKRVRPEVPGCPEPIINDAVVQAAIRLCSESRVWVERLAPIDVFKDIGEYELIGPYPSEVIAPVAVAWDDIPLGMTTLEALENGVSNWRDTSATRPSHYFMTGVRRIRLYPMPDADGTDKVQVTAELIPDEDATELPKWLLDDYRVAIENGAGASLLAMSNRAWSNPQKAAVRDRWFSYYIGQARNRRARGFTNRPTSVRMRRI